MGSAPNRASDAGRGTDATGLIRNDVLVEFYRYAPGPPVVLRRHSHEELQVNLNLDLPGGVHYRGAYQVVPPRSLAVIMPGETHLPRDPDARDRVSGHLVLYFRPEAVTSAARAMSGRGAGVPWFRDLTVGDDDAIRRFVQVHEVLSRPSSRLDQDVQVLDFLTFLVERYAGIAARSTLAVAHRAVREARNYLHDNPAADVSLAELSRIGGLSPYRLTRMFSRTVGMPPHSYQIQRRVELAKRLLLNGRSLGDTAVETGFFDLSHLTRHFKRQVGVPPGSYARLAASSRTG